MAASTAFKKDDKIETISTKRKGEIKAVGNANWYLVLFDGDKNAVWILGSQLVLLQPEK